MVSSAIAFIGSALVSLVISEVAMAESRRMAADQFAASKRLTQEQQAASEAFSTDFAEKQRLQSLEDYEAQYAQQKKDSESAQNRYEARRRSRQVGTGFSKRI